MKEAADAAKEAKVDAKLDKVADKAAEASANSEKATATLKITKEVEAVEEKKKSVYMPYKRSRN